MFEKCKANGKYCQRDWLGKDGLCDCLFSLPDERCREAINEPEKQK